MTKLASRSFVAAAAIILLVLVVLPANWHWLASAQGTQKRYDESLPRPLRHERLKAQLTSTDANEVRNSLQVLAALDEPGALDLWKTALDTNDAALRREVWDVYKTVRLQLERKEQVPQVVSVEAPSAEVLRAAADLNLEADIWSSSDQETVAAAP